MMVRPRAAFGAIVALSLLLLSSPAPAAPAAQAPVNTKPVVEETAPAPKPAGVPVVHRNEPLFEIHARYGSFTPQDRAKAITDRLARLAKEPESQSDAITVVEQGQISEIMSGDTVVMAVTDQDALAVGRTREDLAQDYAEKIRKSLTAAQQETSLRAILFGVLFTLLATIALFVALKVLARLFPKVYALLNAGRGTRIRTLRVGSVELISADRITDILIFLARTIRLVATLLLIYLYVSAVFSFFPATKGLAATLMNSVLAPFRAGTRLREILKDLFVGVLFTLVWTALVVGAWMAVQSAYRQARVKLVAWRGTFIPAVRIQNVEVLSADRITDALLWLTQAVRVIVLILLLQVYASSVLGSFPWTRSLAGELIGYLLKPLVVIGEAFIKHVPNLISIAVIVLVTHYVIKLVHLVFTGIERGTITFSGFHREWANPTYKIVRFMILAFAAIAIFPYIPGSNSEAFRAISIFLGVLVSLGSTSSISNIVAGVVLTYMRPFQLGDRVKIADTVGDVIAKELLVTRVRTIKNVDVTIPNAMVLGSHIINYSSSATDRGLILNTSVTIGYDAPWRKVHELLIAAAGATQHIMKEPAPFVLQTSLDDFFVTYEINAYTDQPNKMAVIYAELHQNIQDKFNEGGVEIMSPHYATLRDGNYTTIPEQYRQKGYTAPSFRITNTDAPIKGDQP